MTMVLDTDASISGFVNSDGSINDTVKSDGSINVPYA